MKLVVVALPALFLASAASAQLDGSSSAAGAASAAPAETSAAASTDQADSEDRQICRRIETNTGSRVPHRRVCMTEAEWRVFNRQN